MPRTLSVRGFLDRLHNRIRVRLSKAIGNTQGNDVRSYRQSYIQSFSCPQQLLRLEPKILDPLKENNVVVGARSGIGVRGIGAVEGNSGPLSQCAICELIQARVGVEWRPRECQIAMDRHRKAKEVTRREIAGSDLLLLHPLRVGSAARARPGQDEGRE